MTSDPTNQTMTVIVCRALQEGTEPRVWQQLLRICQGSEACLSVMLLQGETGAHHAYFVLRCL
jgi:hypothetical protein